MDMRTCESCGNDKPVETFGVGGKWSKKICKDCHLSARKEKWASRPVSERRVEALRNAGVMIDVRKYEAMVAEANGKCQICGSEEAPEASGTAERLHLDHCHATGWPRGFLCRSCNHLIGNSRESIDILLKAVEYLRGFGST